MADTPEQAGAWKALERRWEELGFEGLSQDEREAIALFWLEGEVMNGGMHQYFFNSSGDLAPLAASALKRLGATQSLGLLESCMAKFGPVYPVDREKRGDILDRLGWDTDPFDSETRVLQELPEDFFRLALDRLTIQHKPK